MVAIDDDILAIFGRAPEQKMLRSPEMIHPGHWNVHHLRSLKSKSLPSGHDWHSCIAIENPQSSMGKLTMSMAIFKSYVSPYQRVSETSTDAQVQGVSTATDGSLFLLLSGLQAWLVLGTYRLTVDGYFLLVIQAKPCWKGPSVQHPHFSMSQQRVMICLFYTYIPILSPPSDNISMSQWYQHHYSISNSTTISPWYDQEVCVWLEFPCEPSAKRCQAMKRAHLQVVLAFEATVYAAGGFSWPGRNRIWNAVSVGGPIHTHPINDINGPMITEMNMGESSNS